MTIVQIYLTQPSNNNIELLLPAGRYKVKFTGAQTLYAGGDALKFTLQFRSNLTKLKYGNQNQNYFQISMPHAHQAQIQGELCWEFDYFGPFTLDLIDLSTGVAPVANRFQEGTYYFDLEPRDPNQHLINN